MHRLLPRWSDGLSSHLPLLPSPSLLWSKRIPFSAGPSRWLQVKTLDKTLEENVHKKQQVERGVGTWRVTHVWVFDDFQSSFSSGRDPRPAPVVGQAVRATIAHFSACRNSERGLNKREAMRERQRARIIQTVWKRTKLEDSSRRQDWCEAGMKAMWCRKGQMPHSRTGCVSQRHPTNVSVSLWSRCLQRQLSGEETVF